MRSVTKWQRQASRPREVPDAVFEAFRQMRTGRPRPVLIEMPPEAGVEREEVKLRDPARAPRIVPNPEDLREAAAVIAQASTPLIFAGGGVARSDAEAALVKLAEATKHPGRHIQRRQGHHPRRPSAVLRLLLQPPGRAAGNEPALRGDAGRGRRHRDRSAILAGQSGRRGLHAGEHQHRRQRPDPRAGQHHPPARRRPGDDRGVAPVPDRRRRGRTAVARRSGRRGAKADRLLRHPPQGSRSTPCWKRCRAASRRTRSSFGMSRSSATTRAPTTR